MNSTRRVIPLVQACSRQLSQNTAQVTEVPCKQFAKFKEAQKRFQLPDGLPVHLKGGLKDKILYQFTAASTIVGVMLTLHFFYQMATK